MPLYDVQGRAYIYTVQEVDDEGEPFVPAGFEKTEDGLLVTNTALPTETPAPTETPILSDTGEDAPPDLQTQKETPGPTAVPKGNTGAPRTGDGSPIGAYAAMLMLCVAGVFALACIQRRE